MSTNFPTDHGSPLVKAGEQFSGKVGETAISAGGQFRKSVNNKIYNLMKPGDCFPQKTSTNMDRYPGVILGHHQFSKDNVS